MPRVRRKVTGSGSGFSPFSLRSRAKTPKRTPGPPPPPTPIFLCYVEQCVDTHRKMGFLDPIRLLQNPIFVQKMGFGVWGTIPTIKEWRVISRGNFFILRSIKIKFYRLPLFIPAFIWRICSKSSWVKCLLSLISSATRQKSLKSCNFTPTMGFFEKKWYNFTSQIWKFLYL